MKAFMQENRHWPYLLFWPAFGLRYLLIEQLQPAAGYHPVYCALDDRIPFCEGFVIPYVIWYVFIIGMHLYTFFHDVPVFKRYSRVLILSTILSTTTYLLYPTCQNLRPEQFPRDNFLTDLVGLLYRVDTNTNVCPSEHVIGSVAALTAGLYCTRLKKPWIRAALVVTAFFTSIATVFLKQHSMVDVFAAIPVCALAYLICYKGFPGRRGNAEILTAA